MLYDLIYLAGTIQTGDRSNPWLIAVCMIVSIIVVVGLFIVNQKNQDEDDDEDEKLF